MPAALTVAATVIGRAYPDHKVTGSGFSSVLDHSLCKQSGEGGKKICELAPFEIANASLPVTRIIDEKHPSLFLLSVDVTVDTSVVQRSQYIYIGNSKNSRIKIL